jgi:CRISPR/Cas system-associated endonuclease Cas1
LVVGSTTARRIRISLFEDESEPCSGFEETKTLQKFSSVHAQVHNHLNQERHLVTREIYKQRRSAALAEWRALAA